MKYSELIRLGSVFGPQGFGAVSGRPGTLCANEAAMKALGVDHYAMLPNALIKAVCPVRHFSYDTEPIETIGTIVAHLNDGHRWTREQIAAWVASVEPQDELADSGQGPIEISVEAELSRK